MQQQPPRSPIGFLSPQAVATPPHSPSIGNDFLGSEDAELSIASLEQPNEESGVPSSIDAPTKDHNGDENQQYSNFQMVEQTIEALIDETVEENVAESANRGR